MPGEYSSREQQTAPGTAMEHSAHYLYNSLLHDSATKDLPSDVRERETADLHRAAHSTCLCVRVYTPSLCFFQEATGIKIHLHLS